MPSSGDSARATPGLMKADDPNPLGIETLLAQAGGWQSHDGALSPPIVTATTFEVGGGQPPCYARDQNPAFEPAERLLAALEKGRHALVFSSGMAAATAVFEWLEPGERAVVPRQMYWGLRDWVKDFAQRRSVEIDWVDVASPGEWEAALRRPAKLVWLETPSNPLLRMTDIAQVCALAKQASARVVADNTLATPLLTQPLALGADLVMHSATKALNGHSDVVAGALISGERHSLWEHCMRERSQRGAILGSFEAWLLLRGLRTLALRVRASCDNALAIARFLEGHPSVAEVYYPGLKIALGHELAARQMAGGFGGLVSVRIRAPGDEPSAELRDRAAHAVAERLQRFTRATSLGGVESLVEHRSRVEGPTSDVPPDLLRLSVGIESVDDLVADLSQALAD